MATRTLDRSEPGAPMARYTRVASWLHWIIGAMIIANILIAELSEGAGDADRRWWMGIHLSLGVSVLALSAVRLWWRLTHRPPADPPQVPRWQSLLGGIVHKLFYVLMFALPLTGWAYVSMRAGATGVNWFGLFTIPPLPLGTDEGAREVAESAHKLMGTAMIYLIALHVAGALKHQIVDRIPFLQRMSPHG